MKNKGLFIAILVAALLGIGAIVTYYSYDGQYIDLTTEYNAKLSDNQIIYDKVWKVIKQQAQVSEQYAESFEKIYVQLMDERYESGGAAFKWIQEQNPEFSQDMYVKLMQTIEIQREEFEAAQGKLITVHQELTKLVTKFPGRLFIGSRPIPELKLVTSTKTDETFRTGKEDDVNVFDKK